VPRSPQEPDGQPDRQNAVAQPENGHGGPGPTQLLEPGHQSHCDAGKQKSRLRVGAEQLRQEVSGDQSESEKGHKLDERGGEQRDGVPPNSHPPSSSRERSSRRPASVEETDQQGTCDDRARKHRQDRVREQGVELLWAGGDAAVTDPPP
jgi:hypothetical protein